MRMMVDFAIFFFLKARVFICVLLGGKCMLMIRTQLFMELDVFTMHLQPLVVLEYSP